jgi:hypothetical protein
MQRLRFENARVDDILRGVWTSVHHAHERLSLLYRAGSYRDCNEHSHDANDAERDRGSVRLGAYFLGQFFFPRFLRGWILLLKVSFSVQPQRSTQ